MSGMNGIEFSQTQSDTVVTALAVMLLILWIITFSPFADITRKIIDPASRNSVLTKKPYARSLKCLFALFMKSCGRFVHHVSLSQLLLLPTAWISLIASQVIPKKEQIVNMSCTLRRMMIQTPSVTLPFHS